MTPQDLHDADKIILLRVRNGWIIYDKGRESLENDRFAFVSTTELQAALVGLLGTRRWKLATEK